MDHGAGRWYEIGLSDVVASFFAIYYAVYEGNEFLVRGSAAHQFVQIVVPNRKQAGTDLAVGSDAKAAAVAAEGVGYWGDDANLADAVVKPVAARGFATSTRSSARAR